MDDLSSMQTALVPDVPARLGALEVSAAYRPADGPAAGGDFYDAFALARGRVAIILGDVSGHGRDALHRAAMMRYTLRAYVEAGLTPRSALRLAGDILADGTGEQFTTVVVAVYDPQHASLTFAAAGHPPPIVVGPEHYQPIAVCSSPPIGWGVPTGRRQTTISLPAGALACFFTDGLPEAHAERGMLGRDGVTAILASLSPAPTAAGLLGGVRAAVAEITDDMAACMVTGGTTAAQPFTPLEELELDASQLDGTLAERFLGACHVPAAEVRPAIDQAHTIAASSGAALLRVELAPAGSSVTVTEADRSTPLAAPSGDEPVSLALVS